MNRKSTSMLTLLAALTALAALPTGVRAGTECTDGYLRCVNEAAAKYDAYGKNHFDIVDDIAYLECAAGWTGCVRRKLIGV